MRAEEIQGLMEAYSKVHETPEVVEEELEDLQEGGVNFGGQAAVDKVRARMAAQKQFDSKLDAMRAQRFGGVNPVVKAAKGGVQGTLDKTTGKFTASKPAAAKPAAPAAAAKPAAPAAAAKPAAPAAAAKPAAPTAAKPSAPTTPAAKPAGSAMDQWAAANPKLAAAKAERDRTRGTSATTNPLMKDMKANLPAPKSPSPSTASTGFSLAKKGVNLAADVDIFDLVKGHLLDEGYAETEQNAIVMMANMSEEWRQSILEAYGIEFVNEAKKGDGNLANNYPPYDKVTRGDVIAGALGQDQKGGKKKKNKVTKEELQLDETRTDPRGRPASGPMSVYGGTGKDAGPGGWGNPKIDAMDAAQRRVKATKPAKMGMAADALFTKYSARQRGMEHGSQEGPGAKSPKRGGRTGRGANTDRGKGNAAARRMKEELEAWVNKLIAEGYDLSEYTWDEVSEIYMEELELLDELTGGKGHPGYKAGSKDHGPMQDGHPADSNKRRAAGGTMSMRHGYHLDDMDDEDDDEDEYESILKQQSRDDRERTRKPLRDKVKAARKVLSKEEVEQLNEISLKTKMKAYAASRDVDADYAYGSKVHDQGDRIKANIVKKHGKEAGEHAERHADVSNFGRKDASGKYKGLPKSRIEKSDYRTTASGKMHKQDQSELKRELRIRRGKKLRAADADDDN